MWQKVMDIRDTTFVMQSSRDARRDMIYKRSQTYFFNNFKDQSTMYLNETKKSYTWNKYKPFFGYRDWTDIFVIMTIHHSLYYLYGVIFNKNKTTARKSYYRPYDHIIKVTRAVQRFKTILCVLYIYIFLPTSFEM